MIAECKTISLGGLPDRAVIIRELTMGEIRAMLRAREAMEEEGGEVDLVNLMLAADGLIVDDILRLTDLSQEEVDRLTDSDIDAIVETSRELNPRFFGGVLAVLKRFVGASLDQAVETSSAES